MKKIPGHIDFEIIYRKLNGISTEDDDAILARWLEEDAANLDFFRKAEKHFNHIADTKTPIDVEAALHNVKTRLTAPRRHLKVLLKYASSVAAVLLAAFIVSYLLLPKRDKTTADSTVQAPLASPSAINPEKSKAVLTVDNGDRFALSEEEDLSLDLGDVQITKRGTGIEYASASNADDEELKHNTLSVSRGGEFVMTLSDGTRVWLNSETVLRYPVRFSGSERLVELEGEAFFEVAPRKDSPFRVQSRGQIVEALGTSFNVTAYTGDSNILTTLVSGKVKVYMTDNPDENAILLPGVQSCFSLEKQSLSRYNVDVEEFVAWKSGWFVFRNAALQDMMKTLARWYDIEVEFENISAGNIKFTGDIERYDDLSKLLTIIEKTNEVKIRIEGKRIIIN